MCVGYQTAIKRKSPPEPLSYLKNKGLLTGDCLDYGCGRDTYYGLDGFDPYWNPVTLNKHYDTIVCNYVLNVVDKLTQFEIIKTMRGLLKDNGNIYISVRRDLPITGRQGRGCWQRYVNLPYPVLSENKTRVIYVLSLQSP